MGTVVLVEVLVVVELVGEVVADVVVGLPVAGFTWRLSTLKVTGTASASPATAKPSENEPAPWLPELSVAVSCHPGSGCPAGHALA